jgi:hypothetical protein
VAVVAPPDPPLAEGPVFECPLEHPIALVRMKPTASALSRGW